jgi:hypothetical protein
VIGQKEEAMRRHTSSLVCIVCLGIVGAGLAVGRPGGEPPEQKPEAPRAPAAATRPSDAPAAPPGAEAAVKGFAADYKKWCRVSDHAHIAPTDCMARPPEGAQMSESGDEKTHGRKLYFLYIKETPKNGGVYDYATAFGGDPPRQPVGQVFVKQSWKAVEVEPSAVPREQTGHSFETREHPEQYLVEGGKAWKTGEAAELYVMYKMDPATKDTDQGWVYATLEPDGSKVIQIGRIASCMGCHEKAEYDRVMGQPRARHEREGKREREEKAKKDDGGK